MLREFHWFCLEHVRAYNASWDYYKGMSEPEIEAERRADSSWQRPSWPLGHGKEARLEEAIKAELHAFAFGTRPQPASPDTPPELREALSVLGLLWPVTMAEAKAKYKMLAKRHHPDANNGDKRSEERLKTINLAYAELRGKLSTSSAAD
jgi:DnaJ-domain-containing protein 1